MNGSGGRLAGRTAIVTGAGQGIGEGVAKALAKEGAALTLAGRTLSKLERVADELRGQGTDVLCAACEVGRRSDVDAMVAATMTHHGRVDILINNAQSVVQRPLEETTDEDIEVAFRSGLLGTFYAMQACLPHLKERGGAIVNFGSTTTVAGEASFGSYTVAKEAIRGMSKVAAREWGPYNVRVNVVCPTARTPAMVEFAAENPERFAGLMAQIPLGRPGDPEADIGRAIAALVSDDLAYLTGATLMLNGGRVFLG